MATKKKKGIIQWTGEVTRTVKETYPIWKIFATDTQAVRFNKDEEKFEFTDDPAFDEWEDMDWKYWLGGEDYPASKKGILDTLENLTALLKATK